MSVNPRGGKASAQATCNGRLAVSTGLVFAFKEVEDPALEARRDELLRTWLRP